MKFSDALYTLIIYAGVATYLGALVYWAVGWWLQ